jgi:hypothetical protein
MGLADKAVIFCLQEEPDEHGQGKWEGKQEGKIKPLFEYKGEMRGEKSAQVLPPEK